MMSLKHDLKAAIEAIEDSVVDATHALEVCAHMHAWHPISTAPSNQDLELEFKSNGSRFRVPFPCRRLNTGEWLNTDLGVRVRIEPIRWRSWSFRGPVIEHASPVPNNDHSALIHTHGVIASSDDEEEQDI
jgi:hypothetical protein